MDICEVPESVPKTFTAPDCVGVTVVPIFNLPDESMRTFSPPLLVKRIGPVPLVPIVKLPFAPNCASKNALLAVDVSEKYRLE